VVIRLKKRRCSNHYDAVHRRRHKSGAVLSTTMQSSDVATVAKTYLSDVTSNFNSSDPPSPASNSPKSKRELAADNWRVLVSLVDVG
jgi:hypothetical protein